jgi:GntR family transcriptional regulator
MMPRPKAQPLFHILTRQIAEKIESGEFQAGDRLPSERWFGDTFGVSRTTVRRAIEELVQQGSIEARGNAVFVSPNAGGAAQQNTISSLTDMARARGLTPSARVLVAKVRPATFDEAEVFKIAPGADVFDLERLRYLDGSPISIDHDRVPLRLLPKAMQIDFKSASFFASLAEAGHPPVLANLQIEARNATKQEADLLKLPRQTPVLVANERATGKDRKVITLGCTVYRSDRHRFLATFVRTPPHVAVKK